MAKKTYIELLKDPRWQKKRLEIIERDQSTCQRCCSEQKELHVHHFYYIAGLQPWEYDNDMLITYCRDCHTEVGLYDSELKELIFKGNFYFKLELIRLLKILNRDEWSTVELLEIARIPNLTSALKLYKDSVHE